MGWGARGAGCGVEGVGFKGWSLGVGVEDVRFTVLGLGVGGWGAGVRL